MSTTTTRQFCTFRLGRHLFGIPVERVQEVFRYQEMTRVPLADDNIRGLINLRGQIVTAIGLGRMLGLDAEEPADDSAARDEESLPMNVVVRSGDEVISFLVDDIGDVLEVGEQDFEPPPETMNQIGRDMCLGVYKLVDDLLLTLDIDRVLSNGIDAQ
ncbi:MAG TPA: chemotaxis protein CheW [Planctomycetes bacterium]|nr:chemotaxis protein CheW [Planctomycetota bacterium]